MSHGGPRHGAGRKPGASTKLNEEARKAVVDSGLTPLDYMLALLRDEANDQTIRMDAAKAAAPYVHAKLANVEMNHGVQDGLGELMKALDGRTRGIPTA